MERAERILDRIRLNLRPEQGRATIQLEPRELGRVTIDLTVRAGRVEARLLAEQPEALATLESHVPELRAMFEQRGIDPQNLHLSFGMAGHESGPGGEPSRDGASRPRTQPIETEALSAGQRTGLTLALADSLGIDTYA
jgi:flagellar hook-length control protein FliK